MAEEFEKCISLCLIYSKDLKHLILKKCKNGKLDGLLVDHEQKGAAQVNLSKILNDTLGLEIPPMRWQIVTTLQNIERKWKIDVYLTVADVETIKHDDFILIDPANLPEECHPNLKWLVPLSIDFTIMGSSFNQILMK
jgi:hypothetical protein